MREGQNVITDPDISDRWQSWWNLRCSNACSAVHCSKTDHLAEQWHSRYPGPVCKGSFQKLRCLRSHRNWNHGPGSLLQCLSGFWRSAGSEPASGQVLHPPAAHIDISPEKASLSDRTFIDCLHYDVCRDQIFALGMANDHCFIAKLVDHSCSPVRSIQDSFNRCFLEDRL